MLVFLHMDLKPEDGSGDFAPEVTGYSGIRALCTSLVVSYHPGSVAGFSQKTLRPYVYIWPPGWPIRVFATCQWDAIGIHLCATYLCLRLCGFPVKNSAWNATFAFERNMNHRGHLSVNVLFVCKVSIRFLVGYVISCGMKVAV